MSDGFILDMGGNCEFYNTCGFIQRYTGSGSHLKEGWISMFCNESDMSQNCQRKKMILELHKLPADNMAPTGKLLN